ncbi:MAG TPA: hypothetical protein VNE42_10325 [Acidimicrobiales bacterium]|nr:hypothetical protein [Acidimicrobiales bacterium]
MHYIRQDLERNLGTNLGTNGKGQLTEAFVTVAADTSGADKHRLHPVGNEEQSANWTGTGGGADCGAELGRGSLHVHASWAACLAVRPTAATGGSVYTTRGTALRSPTVDPPSRLAVVIRAW